VIPANLLILDEPTNHLDIHSIAVLIEALKQFTGTFAVVSHDRHFLDQVVTRVWRVEDGAVRVYPGTYSEYLWKVGQEPPPDDAPRATATPEPAPSQPESSEPSFAVVADPDNPYRRMNAFRLGRALEEAEKEIARHEERRAALEASLGDPALYADADRARQATEAYEEIQTDLAALYGRWEAIAQATHEREV
jgi:ATP-binding cassette subfamily F protein 3